MKNRDSLYARKQTSVEKFVFDQQVAGIFDDMIRRSVPGYNAIINMTGVLADQYAQAGTRCYDLGSSLGQSTLALRRRIRQPNVKIIAVDNSEAMVQQCRRNIEEDNGRVPVEVLCSDVQNVMITNASVTVLNFTLQFVDVQQRQALLRRVYDGMVEGGVLIISEKIAFTDDDEQAFQENMHHVFKKLNGYSDLEIAQKRTALENVLVPDTIETHRARLQAIGFRQFHVWFQCFNFVSLIVFK